MIPNVIHEVFRGRDNYIALQLKDEAGVALPDHTVINRAILKMGLDGELADSEIVSFDSDVVASVFDLTKITELRLKLGGAGILNGRFLCRLTTYTTSTPGGYTQPDIIEILMQ